MLSRASLEGGALRGVCSQRLPPVPVRAAAGLEPLVALPSSWARQVLGKIILLFPSSLSAVISFFKAPGADLVARDVRATGSPAIVIWDPLVPSVSGLWLVHMPLEGQALK